MEFKGEFFIWYDGEKFKCSRTRLEFKVWSALNVASWLGKCSRTRLEFKVEESEKQIRKQLEDAFEKYGITPKVVFELDQQFTSYNVSCTGAGISFISDTLIARVPANPRVVFYKLDKELSTRKIYFYWKAGRYVSRAMEEFFKLAEEEKF